MHSYEGDALKPETRYRVTVTVYSESREDRAEAFFDAGKLGRRFEGIWITAEFCKKRDEIYEAPINARSKTLCANTIGSAISDATVK